MKTTIVQLVKYFFVVLYFHSLISQAQINIDSLKNQLVVAKHDSIRLNIYNKLFRGTLNSDPNAAYQFAQKYDSIAGILNNKTEIARGKNYLGMALYMNSDYTNSIKYYLEAIEKFGELKDSLRIGIGFNNIGASYQHRNEPLQTIQYYEKALAIFKKINETEWLGNVSHNIANEYLKLAHNTTDKNLKATYLTNTEKSEQIALSSFKKLKDNYSMGLAYIVFGNIDYEKKAFPKSIDNYTKARQLIDSEYDPISVGIILENIGNSLYELGNYDAAVENLNKAVEIFKKAKALPNLKSTLEILIKVHEKKKQFNLAFDTQKEFIVLSDTLFGQQKDQAMLDVLKKYESEKKDQENKLLNQKLDQEKQQKLAFGIGVVGLIIFSGIIGFFLVKNKQKNKLLNQKNELIEHQNSKLSELNREKNHLISVVSHDLNIPFLTIKMWASILKSNLGLSNPKVEEATQIIEKSSQQGIALIQNILNIEKAETNTHDLELKKVDFVETIQDVSDNFRAVANLKSIELVFEAENKQIHLLSDKHLIARIAENLISNAIKYSPAGKKVWVSVEELNGDVQLKVKDEGVGIEKKDLPKLFAKYGTLASKPTAGESSTGLGLSIVKRILDEIGGKIYCQSEPNVGSEFTVVLKK